MNQTRALDGNQNRKVGAQIQECGNDKQWHSVQAREILAKFSGAGRIVLQVGFGPSGPAHIGTLAEVCRTVMIARALKVLRPDLVVVVQCFIDDQDGLRKVPPGIPNQEMMALHLNKPLCKIPDPFGQCKSYAEYNIKTLVDMLEVYGLSEEVKIIRSSEMYQSGKFDKALLAILCRHEAILNIICKELRPERRATYSPFMPICPETGDVLAEGVEEYREQSIVYRNHRGVLVETPVTGGACKLQWHVDFGMRWAALDVNYEMYGKDLLPSTKLAQQICDVITGRNESGPLGMMYELFLDEDGKKISKSKGNTSIGIDLWYKVAPIGSFYHFIYQNPRRAKRLARRDIPLYVNRFLEACRAGDVEYITAEHRMCTDVSYQLLVELAVLSNCDPEVVLMTLERQGHEVDECVRKLTDCACYFARNVLPSRQLVVPEQDWAQQALQELLRLIPEAECTPESMQALCFSVGNKYAPSLREWFRAVYRGLFGADDGPRIGTFLAYVGKERAIDMLKRLILNDDK
jgi:lysyl-tRNA synthetase class 1